VTAPGVALRRVEEALRDHGSKSNGRRQYQCPAHEDHTPSLSLSQGERGAVLCCHAGCDIDDILSALDLEKRDLFDEPMEKPATRSQPQRVVESYLYTDRYGEPRARKLRYEPKSFSWEIANGDDWRKAERGEGNPGVLYRLPEIAEAEHVHVNEGEKAADALVEAGHCATCAPTSRWTSELVEPLRDKTVTLWVDRDAEGIRKARRAMEALLPVVKTLRVVYPRVEADKADAFDHLAAGHAIGEAVELDPVTFEPRKAKPALLEIAFSGERFLDLLCRPKPEPVCAGIPVPGHLWLIVAPAMTGKSSLAYWLAMARAAGVAPWPDAPAREAGRVLLYSIDEAPEQVARRMNGLAMFHPAGRVERYADNLVVIGPDRDIDPEALDGLRFDEAGLATLRAWLEEADAKGEPFCEVFIDAYADVLPLGASENANEEATRIGGELERVAVRSGAGIALLHHSGKPRADAGDDLPDVRFMGRGASALAAKARVVTALELVTAMPHLRRLRTLTNLGRPPKPALFAVCNAGDDGAEADGGELLYFRPHDPLAEYQPEDVLEAGQEISTTGLAWWLSGKDAEPGGTPPGECKRLAIRLRDRWRKQDRIEVVDGPRGAKLLRLKGPRR
jgi:hypothetical protein